MPWGHPQEQRLGLHAWGEKRRRPRSTAADRLASRPRPPRAHKNRHYVRVCAQPRTPQPRRPKLIVAVGWLVLGIVFLAWSPPGILGIFFAVVVILVGIASLYLWVKLRPRS